MDNYIYSYELDSICNNNDEISYALDKVFYETIVLNGDKLVVTFNQVADSKLFMSLLSNADMKNILLELFKQHKIVISKYTDNNGETISTTVQYVRKQIKKMLQSENFNFIFSSIDVLNDVNNITKKEIFSYIDYSLSYCDINYLSNALESMDKLSNKSIDMIVNYVDFLIRISINNIEYLCPKPENKKCSFTDCIKIAIDVLKLQNKTQLICEIEELYTYLLKNMPHSIQNRSNWIKGLSKDNKMAKEIETILDVCYNLTVEASISNIESIVSSKNKTAYFIRKWEITKKHYKKHGHSYTCCSKEKYFEESSMYIFSLVQTEYWKSAVRIINNVKAESSFNVNWSKTVKRVRNKTRFFCLITILGTLSILIGFNAVSDFIFDVINNAVSLSMSGISFIISIMTNILAIFLGDLFGYKFKINNLAEIIYSKERKIDNQNYKNIITNSFYNPEVV